VIKVILNALFFGCCHLVVTTVAWALADGPNSTPIHAVPWNLLSLPVFGFDVRNLANEHFWELMLLNSAVWTFSIVAVWSIRRLTKSR
jgi:hypothetical protein